MDKLKFAGHELKIINNLSKRYLDKNKSIKDEENLTSMQGWIIKYIFRNENRDIFQKDIENEFSIRRSTATVILQLMEKNNLIIRESVTYDARLKKIILTEKAIEFYNTIKKDILKFEEQLIKDISEEELKIFFKVIEKMKKNLE